jgi:hypothetical protein
MEYALYFRSGTRGPWILLQDKIREAQYAWDTRGVADGRYQLRVQASDRKSNGPSAGLPARDAESGATASDSHRFP